MTQATTQAGTRKAELRDGLGMSPVPGAVFVSIFKGSVTCLQMNLIHPTLPCSFHLAITKEL